MQTCVVYGKFGGFENMLVIFSPAYFPEYFHISNFIKTWASKKL